MMQNPFVQLCDGLAAFPPDKSIPVHGIDRPCVLPCVHRNHKAGDRCTPKCMHVHSGKLSCANPCVFISCGEPGSAYCQYTYCVGSGKLHECEFAKSNDERACPLAVPCPQFGVVWCPVSGLTKPLDVRVTKEEDFSGRSIDNKFVSAPCKVAPVPVPRARRSAPKNPHVSSILRHVSAVGATAAFNERSTHDENYTRRSEELRTARELARRPIVELSREMIMFLATGEHRSGADATAAEDMAKAAVEQCKGGVDLLQLATWLMAADERYRILEVAQVGPGAPGVPERDVDRDLVLGVAREIAMAYEVLHPYIGSVTPRAFVLAYLQYRSQGIRAVSRSGRWLVEPMPRLRSILPSPDYIMRTLSTWSGGKIVPRDVTTALRVLPQAMNTAASKKDWPLTRSSRPRSHQTW